MNRSLLLSLLALSLLGMVACTPYSRGGGGGDDDSSGPFTQVSAGNFHTCGIDNNGDVQCWGAGEAAVDCITPLIGPIRRELLQLVGAGGLIQVPSGAADLLSAELRPYIDLYYRGTGVDAEERIKLWKLAWDAIGSEFGARQELFERSYAGNYDNVRLENLFLADHDGDTEAFTGLVDDCLAQYDLEGWKS